MTYKADVVYKINCNNYEGTYKCQYLHKSCSAHKNSVKSNKPASDFAKYSLKHMH